MKIWSAAKIIRIIKNLCLDPRANFPAYFDSLMLLIQEKRLGIDTRRYFYPQNRMGLFNDGNVYTATAYRRLQKMMSYLKLNKEDVFVDLGCGAGRAIFLAGTKRLKKIIGVEIVKEVLEMTQDNLKKLKLNRTPIEIIHGDACNLDVREGTVFFMFNPFGEKTFTKVMENIRQSLKSNPRKIRIAYYVPGCRNLLDAQDWLVAEGQIGESGIFVWHSRCFSK